MTPNEIEVLIHYYTSPGPPPRVEAPAVLDAIRRLRAHGLLDNGGRVTERGEAHVKQLCSLPFPVQVLWIGYDGNPIE